MSVLPAGVRRNSMLEAFLKVVEEAFALRVLSFDLDAARLYGQIMSNQKNLGKTMSLFDGQIASIAQLHNAILATRNIKDFEGCDITVINPFEIYEE